MTEIEEIESVLNAYVAKLAGESAADRVNRALNEKSEELVWVSEKLHMCQNSRDSYEYRFYTHKKGEEKAIKERDEARAEVERLNAQILEYQCRCNPYVSLITQKDLDEARSEVEKLKEELRQANSDLLRSTERRDVGAKATPTRPEPSRLEIAADLLCAWESRAEITNVDKACKAIADTLIAAAKGEVGK